MQVARMSFSATTISTKGKFMMTNELFDYNWTIIGKTKVLVGAVAYNGCSRIQCDQHVDMEVLMFD